MNPLAGVLLIAAGGLAAGSFYLPLKKVRNWAWESGWLAMGFFAWVIAPWVTVRLTVPGLWDVLKGSPGSSLLWCYIFGLLWGVGGLTFGMSMRYLGMSLGYSLALGFTAAFGTIIPPVYYRTFLQMLRQPSGLVTLAGVLVCLAGIGVVGRAGMVKEQRLTAEQKKAAVREFDFRKGFGIAVLCGVMSACFAFGIVAGKPIAARAVAAGASPLWQNGPVFIVVMAGGFTTNFLWCFFLSLKNRSARDFINREKLAARGQPFLCRPGGRDLVPPVHVLWYGRNQNGEIRFFELVDPDGLHHRLQQPLGLGLEGMEGGRQAHLCPDRGRDRHPHPLHRRHRGGQLLAARGRYFFYSYGTRRDRALFKNHTIT